MTVLDILFYTFIAVVTIQLFYYGILFSKFAFQKVAKPRKKNIPVSVLICAKNEAENLKAFIPSIINQDYHDFEIILINDGSSDDTLSVMKSFETENNHVRIVDVKPVEAFWGSKKYALTLGIKAASHNFLLFTDADCKPVSNNWIKRMSSHFDKQKTIVIGYGAYKKEKGFLNKLVRFETVMTAIQFFSYTLAGMPYMAVGRNLAYRKEEFFNARGYMDHMDVRSGDDDLFVNQIATKKNAIICTLEDSFTESLPKTSFKSWFKQKKRHVSTASRYRALHKFLLGLFYLSQFLFWSVGILLIAFLYNWKIVLGLIILRFLVQYVCFFKSSRKLKEQDLIILLPVLEVFLIVVQLVIFMSNLTTKNSRWN
jgi:glycosyltransferase involved in cell wall biosynthesis